MKLKRFLDRLRGREYRGDTRSSRVNAELESLGTIVRSRIIGTDSLALTPPGHQLRLLGAVERSLEDVRRSCENLSSGNDTLAARARDVCTQIEASLAPQGEVRALLDFWPASWDLAAPRIPPIMARLSRLHAAAVDLGEVTRLRAEYRTRATTLRTRYVHSATAAVDSLLSESVIDQAVEQMRSPAEGVRALQRLDLLDQAFTDITKETSTSLAILAQIASEPQATAHSVRANELAELREGYLSGHWKLLMHLEEQEGRRADALLSVLRRPTAQSARSQSRKLLGGVQEGALHRWVLLYLAGHKPAPTLRS